MTLALAVLALVAPIVMVYGSLAMYHRHNRRKAAKAFDVIVKLNEDAIYDAVRRVEMRRR